MSYNKVKKLKGERYAKVLRDAEGGILGIPEIAEIVRYAGDDAKAVVDYLRASVVASNEDEVEDIETPDSVESVLLKSGYSYHLIKSKKDQEKFRKYYRKGELLCSFTGSAWNWDVIFFAVRHDAESVKPSDKPAGEDDYSTSVLRIKLSNNAISIVSRYNHSVSCADNVYKGNLDKIADGLTAACAHQFKLEFTANGIRSLLPENYHVAGDGRIFYSDCEQGGVWIGESAWLETGQIHTPKTHEIIIEGCILSADCTELREIAEGSDIQGIIQPWNDNAKAMLADGYKFARDGMTIFAIKNGIKEVIAELV